MKDKQKLYEDYKIKSFAKGKTPDSYEVWIKQFKKVDGIKPNNNEILAEKTNEEVETEKNFFDQSVGGNSPAYYAANYMFYKCYNIYFDPKYDSKNLY